MTAAPTPDPSSVVREALVDCLDEYDGSIEIPDPTAELAIELATVIDGTQYVAGKRPSTLAGGCLYAAGIVTEAGLTRDDIGALTGASRELISRHYPNVAAVYLDEVELGEEGPTGYEHDHGDPHRATTLEKLYELSMIVEQANANTNVNVTANAPEAEIEPETEAEPETNPEPETAPSPSLFERFVEAIYALRSGSRYQCPDCGRAIPADGGSICSECGTNAIHAFDDAERSSATDAGGADHADRTGPGAGEDEDSDGGRP
jgi:hypothetical protein